jgi:hypothetical protein
MSSDSPDQQHVDRPDEGAEPYEPPMAEEIETLRGPTEAAAVAETTTKQAIEPPGHW